MALNLISIIKMVAQSKLAQESVVMLIDQYKKIKNRNNKPVLLGSKIESEDLRQMLEVQGAINEKLEKQIVLLQTSIEKLQGAFTLLKNIVLIGFALIIVAIIVISVYK